MRTVSVKEAAEALGVTTRAIIYRIQNGDLKGNRTPNQYGVQEWRIYPTKEIQEGLKRLKGDSPAGEQTDFSPEVEAVEAESVHVESEQAEDVQVTEEILGGGSDREKIRLLAEEMIKPLIETIREQERQIEEQGKQLKLLPDLQKRAEEERKAVELKSLEVEALKKQIGALEQELNQRLPAEVARQYEEEKSVKESQLIQVKEELEAERKAKENELALLKEQLATIDEYKKSAEEAQKEMEELKRLQAEKEAQTASIQEQLAALSERLEKSERPWWKKFLGVES